MNNDYNIGMLFLVALTIAVAVMTIHAFQFVAEESKKCEQQGGAYVKSVNGYDCVGLHKKNR